MKTNVIYKENSSQEAKFRPYFSRVPTNCNLYAYGANNPVHYIDPDGNQSLPCISPREFFSFICKNDPTAKVVMTAGKAAEGDPVAQQLMKETSAAVGKEMAANGLEATANAAEVVSDITSDLAIEAIFVQPEVAGTLGTVSEIASGVETGARVAKAAITKNSDDINKATHSIKKNVGSFVIGHLPGLFKKQLSDEAADLVGESASRIYENIVDSSFDKDKVQE